MTPRRPSTLRRIVAPALLALLGAGWLVAGGFSASDSPSVGACGSAPCAVEAAERSEPARPAAPERPIAPSPPTLDWRSLLPAGFLRPR
jgi:hypothetical protein